MMIVSIVQLIIFVIKKLLSFAPIWWSIYACCHVQDLNLGVSIIRTEWGFEWPRHLFFLAYLPFSFLGGWLLRETGIKLACLRFRWPSIIKFLWIISNRRSSSLLGLQPALENGELTVCLPGADLRFVPFSSGIRWGRTFWCLLIVGYALAILIHNILKSNKNVFCSLGNKFLNFY